MRTRQHLCYPLTTTALHPRPRARGSSLGARRSSARVRTLSPLLEYTDGNGVRVEGLSRIGS